MKAVKGNKEYTIEDTQQKGYQDMGFDITDDSGEIIAYGRGKTVPYGEYMKIVNENERLHERIAELEPSVGEKPAEGGTEPEENPDKKKAGTKKAGE